MKYERARYAVTHFRPYLCQDATIYACVAQIPGFLCLSERSGGWCPAKRPFFGSKTDTRAA